MSEFKICLKRAFDLKGRSTRRELFLGLIGILSALVVMCQAVLVMRYFAIECSALVGLWTMGLVWMYFTVRLRRIHDVGKSVVWFFIPVVSSVLLFFDSQDEENKWGLDPKSEYYIDDFVDSRHFYRYLDKKIVYKHGVCLSSIFAIWKICIRVFILLSLVIGISYLEDAKLDKFVFECEKPVILEIPDSVKLSKLSARSVCILEFSEFDGNVRLYITSDKPKELKYKKKKNSASVTGVIDFEGVNFRVDGSAICSKEELRSSVESLLQCMKLQKHKDYKRRLKEGLSFLESR